MFILMSQPGWAGILDKDPIQETQTNVVAVTEETFKKYENKPGAPAPTFKIIDDTGTFFVEKPAEKQEREEMLVDESTREYEEKIEDIEDIEDIENQLPSVTQPGS